MEIIIQPKPTCASFKDLTGQRFSRLVVIAYVGRIKKHSVFQCLCDCGTSINVRSHTLLNGDSKSCGCLQAYINAALRTTHGLSKLVEYGIWCGIKNRCNNPKVKAYKNYGGRGIKICQRWSADFAAFYSDMGARPTKKHEVERRDNDGDYSPENCYWATRLQQQRNTRRSVYIEHDGRKLHVSEWARETGIPERQILKRLGRGWTAERALFQALRSW